MRLTGLQAEPHIGLRVSVTGVALLALACPWTQHCGAGRSTHRLSEQKVPALQIQQVALGGLIQKLVAVFIAGIPLVIVGGLMCAPHSSLVFKASTQPPQALLPIPDRIAGMKHAILSLGPWFVDFFPVAC